MRFRTSQGGFIPHTIWGLVGPGIVSVEGIPTGTTKSDKREKNVTLVLGGKLRHADSMHVKYFVATA